MADPTMEEAMAALQTQHNDLKAKVEGFLEREHNSSLAGKVNKLETIVLHAADLIADTQLACFRTDKLATVNAVKAAAAEIQQRRSEDAAEG